MYYEYRYVRVDGTFKVVLLVLGAFAAPFALFLLPASELAAGDLIAWAVLLALTGALVGTILGYTIDAVVARIRTWRT